MNDDEDFITFSERQLNTVAVAVFSVGIAVLVLLWWLL